jgi:hypothetical protein
MIFNSTFQELSLKIKRRTVKLSFIRLLMTIVTKMSELLHHQMFTEPRLVSIRQKLKLKRKNKRIHQPQ